MTNQFANTYKKLPTSKLLEIIETPKDYQPIAFEAAKIELASRQDIEDAKRELKEKSSLAHQKKFADDQKRQELKYKASKVLEYADPLVEKKPERSILMLVVILLFVFIYKTVTSFGLLADTLQNFTDLNLSGLWFLIEYFYLPFTLFFVWRKTKRGWTMLFIWFIYQGVLDCLGLYMCYQLSGVDSPLIRFIPMPDISTYLFTLLIHIGLIYFICKPNIKSLFADKEPKTIE